MKKEFCYDAESGISICKIFYKNFMFLGDAYCHPDDVDMCSEITGLTIAENRATIKYLQHIRDCELWPAHRAMNHLLCGVQSSQYHNMISYETQCIKRELQRLEKEIATVNNDLAMLRKNLKLYIAEKENLYQKIRKDKSK